jgi:hypothetical protein
MTSSTTEAATSGAHMEPKSSTTADHVAIDIEPEPQTHTDVFEMDW